jgi:polar amino acid transport system permease protein
VGAGAALLFVAWLVKVALTSPALEWSVVGQYLFSHLVLVGVAHTLELTALTMAFGMTVGTIIALMRLSPNVVLTTVAYWYQWLFRGIPSLVWLVMWFALASVFPRIHLHVGGLNFINADTNHVMTPVVAAVLGIGLNFAAYYSEIVRSGILSVDEGQSEAATAYGLGRLRTMRHIVLPQAMRVIIPPTGNQLIGMLKWTSLASVIAYTEVLQEVTNIYGRTFQVIPMLTVASLWYLFLTSILSIGQYFVERRFARGATRHSKQPKFVEFWSKAIDGLAAIRSRGGSRA